MGFNLSHWSMVSGGYSCPLSTGALRSPGTKPFCILICNQNRPQKTILSDLLSAPPQKSTDNVDDAAQLHAPIEQGGGPAAINFNDHHPYHVVPIVGAASPAAYLRRGPENRSNSDQSIVTPTAAGEEAARRRMIETSRPRSATGSPKFKCPGVRLWRNSGCRASVAGGTSPFRHSAFGELRERLWGGVGEWSTQQVKDAVAPRHRIPSSAEVKGRRINELGSWYHPREVCNRGNPAAGETSRAQQQQCPYLLDRGK